MMSIVRTGDVEGTEFTEVESENFHILGVLWVGS
jgi:hypothetical protein